MYHGSINENDLKYLSREELDKRITLVKNNLRYVRTGDISSHIRSACCSRCFHFSS